VVSLSVVNQSIAKPAVALRV